MTKLIVGLMLAGVLVVGCDKGADGGAKTEGSGKAAAAGEKAEAKGGGESTGAKECDDYIKAIEDCAKKNPAMGKAQLDNIGNLRTAWKAGLSNEASKGPTIESCKTGADTIKQTCLQ